MADYAKTRIDAGKDKDGKARTFEVGQEVTGLSEQELQQLRDAGSLSDQPVDASTAFNASAPRDPHTPSPDPNYSTANQPLNTASGIGGAGTNAQRSGQQSGQNTDTTSSTGREPPGPDTSTKRR